jgi:hypothetical protein
MKNKRKEDWIRIMQPDGEDRIASPSYIRKLLKIESRDQLLSGVLNRLNWLERHVDQLEAPGRKQEVLDLLREHGSHNKTWIFNRVVNLSWRELSELVSEGLIVKSKSGSQSMFSAVARARAGVGGNHELSHVEKQVLKLWLEGLDKLAKECSKTGHMVTGGEVNKFIVGANEIIQELAKVSLFKEKEE